MITRLKVKNYRSIEEIDLTFGAVTALVGKNGAGKNTVFDVLGFVRDALDGNMAVAIRKRGGIDAILHRTANDNPGETEILLEFTDGLTTGQYAFTFAKRKKTTWSVKEERYTLSSPVHLEFRVTEQTGEIYLNDNGEVGTQKMNSKVNTDLWLRSMGIEMAKLYSGLSDRAKFYQQIERYNSFYPSLVDIEFYHLAPNVLHKPQVRDEGRRLLPDGSNFAAVLSKILKDEKLETKFCAALRRVFTDIDEVRVSEVAGYQIAAFKHRVKNGAEKWCPLEQESDGMLKLVALLTALLQDSPHTLIGIENAEVFLTPLALDVLSDVIREAARKRQVIVKPQTPAFISKFAAHELCVV